MNPVPILLYHSIAEDASKRFRPWTVRPRVYRQHMQLLADRGHEPISVSRLVDALAGVGPPLPSAPVLVTFDDAYLDFHTQALPVLERHGFPSTLYVVTGCVGGTAGWLAAEGEGDRAMMGWAELRDAAERGVDLGAHSHTHPKLDELPLHQARDEIVRSRQILEDGLRRAVRTFAYPHGFHGPKVRQLVVDAGYDGAAAVRHAMSSTRDDPFALARIIVYADTSVSSLDRMLRGECLPQAPFPAGWRSTAWRLARRSRRSLAATTGRGGSR